MDKREKIGKKNRLMQYGVLLVSIVLIAGSLVYGTIIISDSGVVDEFGYNLFISDADFIVVSLGLGAGYVAVNGTTGLVAYRNTTYHGGADDVIQSCIDELVNVRGGLIHLRSGNYIIDDTIKVYGNIYLRGSGKGAGDANTYIYLYDESNCDLFNFTVEDGETTTYFGKISDMTIVGNSDEQSGDYGTSRGIVVGDQHFYTTVDDVHIQGINGAGYYIGDEARQGGTANAYGHKLMNSWLHDPVHLNFSSAEYGDVQIINNVFSEIYSSHETEPLRLDYACNKLIQGNTFSNNPENAIGGNLAQGLRINDNIFVYNSNSASGVWNGINLTKCHKSVITDNIFGRVFAGERMNYGVYLDECQDMIISGNRFNTLVTSGIGWKDIAWAGGYSRTYITDNPSYNPVGSIATAFRTTGTTIGINGNTAVPVNNTLYIVYGFDLMVSSSGGTGVNISVYDRNDVLLSYGATELNNLYLPYFYKIRFIFDDVPTVTVMGC